MSGVIEGTHGPEQIESYDEFTSKNIEIARKLGLRRAAYHLHITRVDPRTKKVEK